MAHRKFHILGPAGSGKSYLAAQLSARYGIPTYDLDDIFWDNRADGYGVMADPVKRDDALEEIIGREAWIIEGAYCRWVCRSLEEADVVVLLKTPRWLCEYRILRRFILRKLGLLPSKKKEPFLGLWRLLKWNHKYETDSLPHARDFMKIARCKVVECRTLEELIRMIEE